MKTSWTEIINRISVPNPDGIYPSVHTGAESDAELRELLLAMINNCCVEQSHSPCHLRPLQGLSYSALQNTLQGLDRQGCLEWIEAERKCRQKFAGRNCLTMTATQNSPPARD